jgi:6-phosphogluconolactonase
VSGLARIAGLRGEQVVCATPETCAARLASTLVEHVRRRLEAVADAHLALSGGSSGRLLCAALAQGNHLRAAEWQRVHLWLVDERPVVDSDPRLNFALLRDGLAPHVALPTNNLHPMPVLQADGPERYQRELRSALDQRRDPAERCLDGVVLGMGADGHMASLFPGSPALRERERWIVHNDGEGVAPPRPRMTMTFPLLGRARFIAFLVTGKEKQTALRRAAADPDSVNALPVARLIPDPGSRLCWFLDDAAVAPPAAESA